ncbi:protein kinase [Spongiactinospora sp. TRM90649]|nr:serine/threonine protein kinase [Spongiactinospora sp. TRM90649]MDF5753418.1 protein kinase [Spongiactinospora sp. TRM90649]
MNQDDRLGPYRLLRRLGEGGMGVVHLAVDRQGREVAVKALRPEVMGDDVARRRLAREVETMRRVRSEYIAEVVDADVTGHRPYIVTRYVPGQPLDDLVKEEGPLGAAALLKVARGVAVALAAVHAGGVIHRDLKPGNVMILDGEPVLIDFGIAQAVDATRLTQTGMFIGTPGYLAPEIIEGQEAGPEVDVHAWAGTMLFACSGQPPFGKGTLEMIFYNITAGKANIDAAPPVIQPVLRAALQRDPARRPKAAELADQIGRLMPRAGGRPRMPDEITTVPDVTARDSAQERAQERSRDVAWRPGQGEGDVPTPPVGPSRSQVLRPEQEPRRPEPSRDHDYVSLLGEQPGPDTGDPFPTRRVPPEELRQIRQGVGGQDRPAWDTPTQGDQAAMPTGAQGWDVSTQADAAARPTPPPVGTPVPPGRPHTPDGDIPTQRVRPGDIPEYIRNYPTPGYNQPQYSSPYGQPNPQPNPQHGAQPPQGPPGYGQGGYPGQQQTPYAPPYPQQGGAGYPGHGSQQPSQQPVQQQSTQQGGRAAQAGPGQEAGGMLHPGQRPGNPLQRSRAYGVAAVLLLIVVAMAAIIAPVLVAVVAIPIAIVLRAADIAQPAFGDRPAGAAALDVVRVFTQPLALAKSAGITLALVPYALILGLPVTLLLTVLVQGMPIENALSWGAAVALWTICAGPGVEGPGRQMRRTLASLVPGRTPATVVAGVLAGVALLLTVLAVGTVREGSTPAQFAPIGVDTVTSQLSELRHKADQ